ncbi:BBE domain-containing protein [Streptomyces mordarskii]|uniref:BBE domain-containing protein n=1 Tax=Streptomyces mordarskii TaxID=1226758 RepID=UPI003D15E7CD
MGPSHPRRCPTVVPRRGLAQLHRPGVPGQGRDRVIEGFGAENYHRRLAGVKALYDPDDVFRLDHNIEPRIEPRIDRAPPGGAVTPDGPASCPLPPRRARAHRSVIYGPRVGAPPADGPRSARPRGRERVAVRRASRCSGWERGGRSCR